MIPPRVVLAAIDFSDCSRVALTFAARLAAHSDAALHVLHVEDPVLAAAAQARGVDLARDTLDELGIFTRSAPPAAERSPKLHVAAGPAADTICKIARREHADVVVIGMRGISAVEHVVFGSTTEAVLRAADGPVFAVPDGWAPPAGGGSDLRGLGPVVAAVDTTDAAVAAAHAAARLADLLRTSLEVLHVTPALRVLNRWQTHADAVVRDREAQVRKDIETALRGLRTEPPFALRVESGNVAQRIADAVAASPPRRPVLVMGRHPRSAGATAYRILTLATAPVLQWAGAGPEGRRKDGR